MSVAIGSIQNRAETDVHRGSMTYSTVFRGKNESVTNSSIYVVSMLQMQICVAMLYRLKTETTNIEVT